METVKVRMLPVFLMEGTEFFVDTQLNEFRQKDAPWNRISMNELTELSEGDVTALVYDTDTKNIYEGIVDPDNIPAHVKLVILPSLMELDPVGMARKYGLADAFTKKQVMEDNAFEKRQRRNTRRHL